MNSALDATSYHCNTIILCHGVYADEWFYRSLAPDHVPGETYQVCGLTYPTSIAKARLNVQMYRVQEQSRLSLERPNCTQTAPPTPAGHRPTASKTVPSGLWILDRWFSTEEIRARADQVRIRKQQEADDVQMVESTPLETTMAVIIRRCLPGDDQTQTYMDADPEWLVPDLVAAYSRELQVEVGQAVPPSAVLKCSNYGQSRVRLNDCVSVRQLWNMSPSGVSLIDVMPRSAAPSHVSPVVVCMAWAWLQRADCWFNPDEQAREDKMYRHRKFLREKRADQGAEAARRSLRRVSQPL